MKTETINNKVQAYFSSVNSTSRRMMIDLKSISDSQKRNNAAAWSGMGYPQQQEILYQELVRNKVKDKYSYYPSPESGPPSFPKLIINSGEKMIVDPEHEDSSNNKGTKRIALHGVSWRDEHSAPFSWETRSQLEASLNDDSPENAKNVRNSQINYEDLVLEKWKFQFPEEHGSEIAPNEVLKELGLNNHNNQKIDWNLPKVEDQKITWNLPEDTKQKLQENLPFEAAQNIWNLSEENPNSEWSMSEENPNSEWNLSKENPNSEWSTSEENPNSEWNLPEEETYTVEKGVLELDNKKSAESQNEAEYKQNVLLNHADVVQELMRHIPQPIQDEEDDDDLSIPKTGFDFLDNW